MQGARQLHVILSVGRLYGDGAVACRIIDLDRRWQLAGAQPFARLDFVDLGARPDVAITGLADLGRFLALDGEQRAEAGMFAAGSLEVRPLLDAPTEHTSQRQPADGTVEDLEDVHRRVGHA